MKCVVIALASSLMCLAGCASAPRIALSEAVGPGPSSPERAAPQGHLEVHSARQREPLASNIGEWRWEYDMGDYAIQYSLTHTGYTILSENGRVLEYVYNARNLTDPQPALVRLPPGRYKVEAQSEEPNGGAATVVLPVLIKRGKTTAVHLAGRWKPAANFHEDEIVRLPHGQIAGWLARE